MTNNEIQNVLINILKKEYQETHRDEYKGQISPFTTLGAFVFDSLDITEVILLLEKSLNVQIYDEVIESKFKENSTINDMTLAIASLHPRRTTDWYNREFPDKKIDPRTDIVLNKLVHQK